MPGLTETVLLVAIVASLQEAPLPDGADLRELGCLARNVYFEAGGESDAGKDAVAHVTLNRVKDPRFPETACAVVHQVATLPNGTKICQFSWYCDGKSDRIVMIDKEGNERESVIRRYKLSAEAAVRAYYGTEPDPTGGALYFYAHNLVTPSWADGETIVPTPALPRGRLGGHTFLLDTRATPAPDAQIAERDPTALPPEL